MRDLRYIIKKVIILTLVAILVMLFKNQISFAKVVDCTGTYKLNGQTLSVNSTTTISSGTNYTFSVQNIGVVDDIANFGGSSDFYTDIEFISNLAFGDYSGSSNGATFTIQRLGYNVTGLFDGQKDGAIRMRILWTANTITGQQFPNIYRSGTINNYGGSVNYLGGLRIKSITCGYQSDMPSLDNFAIAELKLLENLTSSMQQVFSQLQSNQQQTNTWLQKVEAAAKAMKESMENAEIEENNQQFNEFNQYLAQNGVITNLITMPLTLFQKVLSTINGTCVDYNLGSLYNSNLILPCIDISDYLGSALWGVIDVIISGLLIYAISRHFVKMFNKMSSLEESDIID